MVSIKESFADTLHNSILHVKLRLLRTKKIKDYNFPPLRIGAWKKILETETNYIGS
jgi:hypothetical protein